MSWIFIHLTKKQNRKDWPPVKQDKRLLFSMPVNAGAIYAGGNPQTCLFKTGNKQKGWISVGTGIDPAHSHFLDKNDWDIRIKGGKETIKNLDGHFVVAKWDIHSLQIMTDRIGLRDFYYHNTKDEIFITTRIDLLSKYCDLNIDFLHLGSKWLLSNQIGSESIIKNISRICGGTLEIDLQSFDKKVSQTPFTPIIDETIQNPEEIFEQKLQNFIFMPLKNNFEISLSLSGGLDSRLILSFLMKVQANKWSAHTFGPDYITDQIISKKIAEDFQINHLSINKPLLPINKCVSKLFNYMQHTKLSTNASAIYQLENYEDIKSKNDCLIDGGFGEIWRREFLKILLIKAKSAVLHRNIEKIFQTLLFHRAAIFTNEINKQMKKGALQAVELCIRHMPEPGTIGIENWLDLFIIRSRLINNFGPEQSRIDHNFLSFMPFAQPSLLSLLFQVPVKERKNGRLFRKLINNNKRQLSSYPLAKDHLTYPYILGAIQSKIWLKIQGKMKKTPYPSNQILFLQHLKEYILDLSHSKSFIETPYYAHKTIQNSITQFYKGDLSQANALDWWLGFEIFRQIIENKFI